MATWVRSVAPATEPVTTSEAKAHVRVDISDDDALIGTLITSAREYVEETARRSLVTQTWKLYLDRWPGVDYITLPRPPLQSVTSVKYTDKDGVQTTWANSNYLVDSDSEPGRIVLAYDVSWPDTVELRPMNPIEVVFVAGYGAAAAAPQRWKQAILLLAGHWYENREATVDGAIQRPIPFAVESLINLDRGDWL